MLGSFRHVKAWKGSPPGFLVLYFVTESEAQEHPSYYKFIINPLLIEK